MALSFNEACKQVFAPRTLFEIAKEEMRGIDGKIFAAVPQSKEKFLR
tara:strand:+ start:2784 stop:2924 length:141 start_codon:yes stop_codon:yes gene_type:complete